MLEWIYKIEIGSYIELIIGVFDAMTFYHYSH